MVLPELAGVLPANGTRVRPGMIRRTGPVVDAPSREIGWEWGGDVERALEDYQHFSENGR